MNIFKFLAMGAVLGYSALTASAQQEIPVWITIGQSNADGSAYADPQEDARLAKWYESKDNPGNVKIWYRSSVIQNQEDGSRWVFDGTTVDAQPGWMDVWYKNDNTNGRTAMNMIHSYGTWSTGNGRNCAQGRRGMEGQFAMQFQKALPDTPLRIIKLGASGSAIDTWADASNDHNWNYFFDNIYTPAMEDLLSQGLKPRLAGIWWMQGCGDGGRTEEYYEKRLNTLIDRLRTQTGFEDAQIYIGDIVAPGESATNPKASVQFGTGVREAKKQIERTTPRVEMISTTDCTFQDDNLHFDHPGINKIGDKLARRAIESQPYWSEFTTPGEWNGLNGAHPRFIPYLGNPEITYNVDGDTVTATLDYGTWQETKTAKLTKAK